jgi:hypothetical protein
MLKPMSTNFVFNYFRRTRLLPHGFNKTIKVAKASRRTWMTPPMVSKA